MSYKRKASRPPLYVTKSYKRPRYTQTTTTRVVQAAAARRFNRTRYWKRRNLATMGFLGIEKKFYDSFLYNLCIIINDNWFKDRDNLWNLAGLISKIPGQTNDKLKCTYCAILYTKLKRFNSNAAQLEFNDWLDGGKSSKYNSKLNISKLKSIAGGCNP